MARSVKITPVDNGYIVQVGCVNLVFGKAELAVELSRWIEAPAVVEAEYEKKYRGSEPTNLYRPGVIGSSGFAGLPPQQFQADMAGTEAPTTARFYEGRR